MKTKELSRYRWARQTINFFSKKNNRSIWCESHLERDAMLRLEFDDTVVGYNGQPISFVYRTQAGPEARYTPDLLIERVDGSFTFQEVKPAQYANCPEFRDKIARLRMHIRHRHNASLEVVTDVEIRVGEMIDNLNLLYRYKNLPAFQWSKYKVKQSFGRSCRFGEAKEFARKTGASPLLPYCLAADRALLFNYAQRLCDETLMVSA
ncbi:MAG: TnsA endonuclease N-terminal domain-containing protein [Thiogranum sp.]|nr:TnsA endonuclease N-terminal domain-containing protein [Thiogranum sp.]